MEVGLPGVHKLGAVEERNRSVERPRDLAPTQPDYAHEKYEPHRPDTERRAPNFGREAATVPTRPLVN